MIHRLVDAKAIPDAGMGFSLRFGDQPFDHDVAMRWIAPGDAATATGLSRSSLPTEGNWYTGEVAGEPMTCWLCPALFCYFEQAPPNIYAKADPLPSGVDPIWHAAWNDPEAKRFMSAESDE